MEQTRRILQHGLRWDRFIKAWRTRTGKTKDLPIRDIITKLAQETRATFDNDPTDTRWPFCDSCSYDYQFSKKNDQGRDHYRTPELQAKTRDLVERAAGATLAFLLNAADSVPPAPTCTSLACTVGSTPCCHGSCQQGVCCSSTGAACLSDGDCCSPLGCRSGQCAPTSTPQGPGATCVGGGAGCASSTDSPAACTTTSDGVSVCCEFPLGDCTSDAQCCTGTCNSDGRCSQAPIGGACTNGLQCAPFGSCGKDGALIGAGSGLTGTCCNTTFGTQCNPSHGNGDCCFGACKQVPDGRFLCESGACGTYGAGCQTGGDCCTGVCGVSNAPNICACSKPDVNAPCATSDDCCSGACRGKVCVTEVIVK